MISSVKISSAEDSHIMGPSFTPTLSSPLTLSASSTHSTPVGSTALRESHFHSPSDDSIRRSSVIRNIYHSAALPTCRIENDVEKSPAYLGGGSSGLLDASLNFINSILGSSIVGTRTESSHVRSPVRADRIGLFSRHLSDCVHFNCRE